jgi:2'-5' RNA ligase
MVGNYLSSKLNNDEKVFFPHIKFQTFEVDNYLPILVTFSTSSKPRFDDTALKKTEDDGSGSLYRKIVSPIFFDRTPLDRNIILLNTI